ncbi:MAG TPA: hypothetical protein VGE52_13160 [Pirellulales bacterium]
MNLLDEATIPKFLARFSFFGDAVIRSIELRYTKSGRQVRMTFSAYDNINGDWGWSNIEIVGRDVEEFVLREGRPTCVVLSQEVVIRQLDGLVWLDFFPSLGAAETPDEFRKSDLYFAAKQVGWCVQPYSES